MDLDSPDALGSTVEPYASPSYLPDDDDDIESELDPGILQHPGEPSSTAANFHYYRLQVRHPGFRAIIFLFLAVNPVAEFIDPVRELKPALKWGMSHTPPPALEPYFNAGFNSRTGSVNSATDPGYPTD